jgi:hypothetical protein
MMPVVFVSGPFRSTSEPYSQWEQSLNIQQAAALALQVWKLGAACICPHLNSAPFSGACDDDVWLSGDLAILARCDAVLLTPDWERSAGARAEKDYAEQLGLPVFTDIAQVRAWLVEPQHRRRGTMVSA